MGNVVNEIDDGDVFVDGKECTDNVCTAAANEPAEATRHVVHGGRRLVCSSDSDGTCVACNAGTVATDCADAETLCLSRACPAHTCGVSSTFRSARRWGPSRLNDCKKNVCDGNGTLSPANDDADVPLDDGEPCTAEICTNGVGYPRRPRQGRLHLRGSQGGPVRKRRLRTDVHGPARGRRLWDCPIPGVRGSFR